VWPASHQVPLNVESGLIHDWIGAAFIPDTTLREMLRSSAITTVTSSSTAQRSSVEADRQLRFERRVFDGHDE